MALDPYLHLLPTNEFYAGKVPLPIPDDAPGAFSPRKYPVMSAVHSWSLLDFRQLGVNLGQHDCEPRVTDNCYFYPVQEAHDVYLVVCIDAHLTDPRHRHWGIRWVLDHHTTLRGGGTMDRAARCLEVTSNLRSDHLINWGPHTQSSKYQTTDPITVFELGRFTKAQLLMMEAIAWHIPVQLPADGEYNCQNWVAAFFSVAVGYGLLKLETVNAVMLQALQREIPSKASSSFS
ncbi:hypothetical protein VNI00_011650 [Paramarasmius palmivorus]|uniref:Uncharacterized protein n=1 Tax=Paramarasmius palmivorus TaxID=297713 RepID=A0AAW0CC68_9AGAR